MGILVKEFCWEWVQKERVTRQWIEEGKKTNRNVLFNRDWFPPGLTGISGVWLASHSWALRAGLFYPCVSYSLPVDYRMGLRESHSRWVSLLSRGQLSGQRGEYEQLPTGTWGMNILGWVQLSTSCTTQIHLLLTLNSYHPRTANPGFWYVSHILKHFQHIIPLSPQDTQHFPYSIMLTFGISHISNDQEERYRCSVDQTFLL